MLTCSLVLRSVIGSEPHTAAEHSSTLTSQIEREGREKELNWELLHKIASCSTDNAVMIWSPSTGERLETLEGHSGAVFCLQFNPHRTGHLIWWKCDQNALKVDHGAPRMCSKSQLNGVFSSK